jgi:hypothetical protein
MADGGRLAFAVLINGARDSALDVDAALDRFVARLAGLGAAAPDAPLAWRTGPRAGAHTEGR